MGIVRMELERLYQPEHTKGVRPRRLPLGKRTLPEGGETRTTEGLQRSRADACSQRPNRPTLAVLRTHLVQPPPVEGETVVEPAVRSTGVLQE